MRILICLILFLSACAPKLKIAADFDAETVDHLAILPPDYPADIQREKVDQIHATLIAELRNENFNVLDPELVERFCETSICPQRQILAEQYGATAFVKLNLSSLANYNFLAARYTTIAGTLEIEDLNRTVLLSVANKQSVRKGLLFDSGQVLTAFKNQASDRSKQIYQQFISKLVGYIPKVKGSRNIDSSSELPRIFSKSFKIEEDKAKICITTSANTYALLIIEQGSYPLKELEAGSHCAFVPIQILKNKVGVEVRSAFGLKIKDELVLKDLENCDLKLAGDLKKEKTSAKIDLKCVDLPGAKPCVEAPNNCSMHQILVYSADSQLGPFNYRDEFKSASWVDKSKKNNYQLLNINPYGFPGLPYNLEEK